jgi:hypothetical protein
MVAVIAIITLALVMAGWSAVARNAFSGASTSQLCSVSRSSGEAGKSTRPTCS